jgi:broad specificity phosphatase PhoE
VRTGPIVALFLLLPASAAAVPEADVWAALKTDGHAALVRHADAPGFGDPPGFRLDDCSTQRTLSGEGRDQARALGARFREHGIRSAVVYSSQWCRCMETARLLGLGAVTAFPGLNSFFDKRSLEARRTAEVKALLLGARGGPLVLVTHQVNIRALTGEAVGSGEIVVVRYDGGTISVIGRIR